MNQLRNQRGYALLVVLFVVLIFFSISAAFMAGSLNHAKQEWTVDTSNQSVAAAEMGVLYYSEDFAVSLKALRDELIVEIQKELDDIATCNPSCDGSNVRKESLDRRMIEEYIDSIKKKVNHMNANGSLYSKNSSADGRINYTVDSADAVHRDGKIEITLILKGRALQNENQSESSLTVLFDVDIPDSFLVTTHHITYDNVYSAAPTVSCDQFLNGKIHETVDPPYECNLGETQKLSDLIKKIINAGLKPEHFRVYTNKYLENVCNPSGNSSNCNQESFQGISVVVSNDTKTGNMNGLSNFKLYISGMLIVDGNLNNTEQTALILKEIDIRNNMKNMDRATLTVLGYDGLLDTARFQLKNNINLTNASRVCINIDLIKKTDLDSLATKLTIDGTSSLLYYTATQDPSSAEYKNVPFEQRRFSPTDAVSNQRVQVEPNYSNFLNKCGVSVSGSHTVPNIIETGFDYEVDYN